MRPEAGNCKERAKLGKFARACQMRRRWALAVKSMARLYFQAVEGPTSAGAMTVKPKIHPNYQRTTVVCACGNTFETRSTASTIHVEICAKCHPYFTGKQKLVDTAGRVERFQKRYGRSGVTQGS
jgi:large subunit ribosomal protein L31